jgi:hypothetical protein
VVRLTILTVLAVRGLEGPARLQTRLQARRAAVHRRRGRATGRRACTEPLQRGRYHVLWRRRDADAGRRRRAEVVRRDGSGRGQGGPWPHRGVQASRWLGGGGALGGRRRKVLTLAMAVAAVAAATTIAAVAMAAELSEEHFLQLEDGRDRTWL